MIEASFDGGRYREAAVSGAYQYDTGQRIRLYGLPSPDELSQMDDFLSGDVVTVQAQFSFMGDSQTEMRLAEWDETQNVWTANVPDMYMQRCEDVHVYVYVSYGSTEESSRAKTLYEAVFRPIGRPAPGTQVTPDQTNAWDELVAEVNLTLATMNTAISGANAATARTNQAITDAQEATQSAQDAAEQIDGMSVEAQTLSHDSEATASVTDTSTGKHIVFGIPRGKPGVFTLNGKQPDESGAVVLTAEDVGARPATWTPTAADVGAYPVGSVYISAVSTSPASLFGGVWEQIKDAFLLSAGDDYAAGSTGGSAEASLDEKNLPNNTIMVAQNTSGKSESVDGAGWSRSTISAGNYFTAGGSWLRSHGYLGGEQLNVSVMPPYLTVYMWKRVE